MTEQQAFGEPYVATRGREVKGVWTKSWYFQRCPRLPSSTCGCVRAKLEDADPVVTFGAAWVVHGCLEHSKLDAFDRYPKSHRIGVLRLDDLPFVLF